MRYAAARLIFALLGFSFALGAYAQDKSTSNRPLSSGDRSFIMQASNGGMTEVELSRIVLRNGASTDVKAFAQQMVEDHEKAGKELGMISAKLGATPPKPMGKPTADIRRFGELKGAMLDKAYVGKMVDGHKGAIALFEKQAKSGDSQDLKQFANKTLPVLKEHLKSALALAEKGKREV